MRISFLPEKNSTVSILTYTEQDFNKNIKKSIVSVAKTIAKIAHMCYNVYWVLMYSNKGRRQE